ncbi:MAG: sialidase family protein [Methanobacteriota archaeon]
MEPVPMSYSGVDFLISYDDDNSAMHPSFAATPPGSLQKEWDGTMHVVWDEKNDGYPWREIHYSQSPGDSGGRDWSNDDPWEDDRVISDPREKRSSIDDSEALLADTETTRAYIVGDAVDPAVAVDMYGFVHVVWREMYSDGTWEIHYSRSPDNGRHWSFEITGGDIRVSNRGQQDGNIPFAPVVGVSNNRGNVIVYAVWAEMDPKGETMDVFMSRSFNGGDSWTGWETNEMVSDPESRPFATYPTMAVSGDDGEVVSVMWSQIFEGTGVREIFATVSKSFGDGWSRENQVSRVTDDGFDAGPPSASANTREIIVTWPQMYAGKAEPTEEILYSYSGNFGDWWLGTERDFPVSCFENGENERAKAPSVALSPDGVASASWTEVDQNYLKSEEIHISSTNDITDPRAWTGLKEDSIISNPDGDKYGNPANAANVSAGFAFVDGGWHYRAFWDEVNYTTSGKDDRIVMDDWEIVTNSPEDYSIPIAPGWNLISVPVIQENEDILTVFNDEAGDGTIGWDRLMWYDPWGGANRWKQYNANWTSSMNDLKTTDHTVSLWIRITNVGDGYLTVTGNKPTSTTISLRAGWNMVGYPAADDSSYTVASLKAATGATIVEGFKSSATYKTEVLGNAIVLGRGNGYWVYVPSDTSWTVDW